MKSQSNQQHKAIALFSLMLYVSIALGITIFLMRDIQKDDSREKAARMAENIGRQIIEMGQAARTEAPSENQSSSRGIASISEEENLFGNAGQVGKDPWGNFYNYKFFQGKEGNYLYVWSNGPNAQSDTSLNQEKGPENPEKFVYSNDDIGVVLRVK